MISIQENKRQLRLIYLVNQYPKISHTFIREEILGLEAIGFDVLRVASRGWDTEIVDPADRAELARTTYLLRRGLAQALIALLLHLVKNPTATLRTLTLTLKLGQRADRHWLYHLAYLAQAALLKKFATLHSIDHIHAHFGTNATEIALLSRSLGGPPFSFTVHGPEEFDKFKQLKLAEKVHASSFVIAISSFGRSQLYRICAVEDWPKVHVVHCGLGQGYLNSTSSKFPKSPFIVCIGRLCEQKGQVVLVRACSLLRDRGVDFKLDFIGDGEMRDEVEAAIAETKLEDRVRIIGWCGSGEIREKLREAKGLVLPSFAEGLPVVIMEAMALGRPVISTYVAGIPELIRDGIDGFLVFAGNEFVLADAIERLLNLDAHSHNMMAEAARERVRQRHSAKVGSIKLAKLFIQSALVNS